jgi:hypothetical protein
MRSVRNLSVMAFLIAALLSAPHHVRASSCEDIGFSCPVSGPYMWGWYLECYPSIDCYSIQYCAQTACTPYPLQTFACNETGSLSFGGPAAIFACGW